MIRRATIDDLDWLLELARERYGAEHVNQQSEPEIRKWLTGALTQSWVCVARGDFGAGVITITRPFYEHESQAHLLFIVSRMNKTMEGYKIARALSLWAFENGAACVHISSGTSYDLEPFAKRMGAVQARPSYVIERPREMIMERAA